LWSLLFVFQEEKEEKEKENFSFATSTFPSRDNVQQNKTIQHDKTTGPQERKNE